MKKFNIRVYGLWINDRQQMLLSDERIGDFQFTKFPGGGLEYGEGIADCLRREWQEELGVDIDILSHFYTTDFFQISAFNDAQIISIYYLVCARQMPRVRFRSRRFDFDFRDHEECSFRWLSLSDLEEEELTLPIDKVVAKMLKERNEHK